jgi:hypothetical protein
VLGYPQLALAALAAAEESSSTMPAHKIAARIRRAVASARRASIARLQSGLGRDLVAVGLLAGAVAYVRLSAEQVTLWFYPLCAAGALSIAFDFIVRRRLLKHLERVGDELVQAAAALAPSSARAPRGPCPVCSGTEFLLVERPATVRLDGDEREVALTDVSICRRCGYSKAQVHDAAKLPVGREFGTLLVSSEAHAAVQASVETEEHQG